MLTRSNVNPCNFQHLKAHVLNNKLHFQIFFSHQYFPEIAISKNKFSISQSNRTFPKTLLCVSWCTNANTLDALENYGKLIVSGNFYEKLSYTFNIWSKLQHELLSNFVTAMPLSKCYGLSLELSDNVNLNVKLYKKYINKQ